MKFDAVIFLSALCVLVSVNAELNENCTAYDGSAGKCIYLSNCRGLLEMVITSKRTWINHDEAIHIIKKSSCGFIQSEPLVCCSTSTKGNGQHAESNKDNTSSDNSSNSDSNKVVGSSPPTAAPSTSAPESTPVTRPSSLPQTGFTNSASTISSLKTQQPPVASAKPAFETKDSLMSVESSTETTPATTSNKVNENLNLLPEVCGRVLTFKYFFGNATDLDDFPWISLLEYDTPTGKRTACGGALINNRYVLTAAHCVHCMYPTWKVSGVRFGEYNTATEVDCLSDGGPDDKQYCADKPVTVAVEEEIVYPGFMPNDRNRLHDIALLRLAEEVKFTDFVQPICLPFNLPDRQRYYTSGWGKSCHGNGTDIKYMSYLSLDEKQSCADKYKSKGIIVGENQICAGVKDKEVPCIGDMGGPLMGIEEKAEQIKRVTVFGVLSMTHSATSSCQKTGWPGVYTKVLDYVPWILGQLKK